jgi:hypothetical protein
MALLAPSIMSTTTCLQLEELQKKPTSFHRYIFSGPSVTSTTTKEEEKRLVSQTVEARQSVLLLKGIREQYTLVNDHTIPAILHSGEILVKVCPIFFYLREDRICSPLISRFLQSGSIRLTGKHRASTLSIISCI